MIVPDEELTPEQLRQRYAILGEDGNFGEHPDHTIEEWQKDVEAGNTRLGYFEWVAAKLLELPGEGS
ncbi:MAG TPA: hypothetical protein VE866_01855 [Candidatus Binatia bacterium]|nr:hypothetical protein [Candidatus Binatia bacterium]